MTPIAILLTLAPAAFFGYAYFLYPLILRVLASRRPAVSMPPEPAVWPRLTITVPVYNEAARIRAALDNLLEADYPAGRRQILVLSDASTDETDEIVRREYAPRGVELLRLPVRRGKTALENAAFGAATGEIVVNMDASIRIRRGSLRALVRAFGDPTVGVASGRDISTGDEAAEANQAESGYVGYEMWVRSLETRLGSIVGASGCFFGTRRELHDTNFPESLSRDFASVLMARERGYRSVSVEDAVCIVPRTKALQTEFRRKARTMSRGLQTLWYERSLMNPIRYGLFAFMLVSHKLCRWLVYLALPLALVGLLVLSARWWPAAVLLGLAVLGTGLGLIGLRWPAGRRVPAAFALPGFILASNAAGVAAWLQALRGQRQAVWEPTRRPA